MNFQTLLQEHMEGSNQKMVAMTALPLLIAAAVFFFLLKPAQEKAAALKREITALDASSDTMRKDVSSMQELRGAVQSMAAFRDQFLNEAELLPMFNSYAVRGRQKLKGYADKAGFDLVTGRDLPPIALRPPKGNFPDGFQLYSRQPVEFTGNASYAQTVEFIRLVEKAFPYVTLYGLSIQPQTATPKQHKVLITFEWPVKGEKISLPKGVRR